MPTLLPDQRLLAEVRRLKSFLVERRIITDREFVEEIFHQFARTDSVCTDIIPELWEMMPWPARTEFASRIRDAARPDFQWRPFYINGPQGTDDGNLRKCDEVGTARIRAWAIEFVRYLDSLNEMDAGAMAAIEEKLSDMENQRTRPFREVLDEIRRSEKGE